MNRCMHELRNIYTTLVFSNLESRNVPFTYRYIQGVAAEKNPSIAMPSNIHNRFAYLSVVAITYDLPHDVFLLPSDFWPARFRHP